MTSALLNAKHTTPRLLSAMLVAVIGSGCEAIVGFEETGCEEPEPFRVDVANAAFDDGHVGWIEDPSRAVITQVAADDLMPHSGEFIARFGGSASAQQRTMRQTIELPVAATRLSVGGQRCFTTEEVDPIVFDTLTLSLHDPATGRQLAELAQLSNLDAAAACSFTQFEHEAAFDAPVRQVSLEFESVLDNGRVTTFNIDTLEVEAFGCP